MNRSRLDAESVRDAVLQITGMLDLTMGGPSVQQFVLSPGIHVTPVVDYTKFDLDSRRELSAQHLPVYLSHVARSVHGFARLRGRIAAHAARGTPR